MTEIRYTIRDPLGIHARPAGMLAKWAKEHEAEVTIQKDGTGTPVRALQILRVMQLAVKTGDTVLFTLSGANEPALAEEFRRFLDANF